MKAVADATAFFFVLAPLAAFFIIEFHHSLLNSDLLCKSEVPSESRTILKISFFEDGVRLAIPTQFFLGDLAYYETCKENYCEG